MSDAFLTWLDSGDQKNCTTTGTTYSQLHCELDAELQKCPDANTDQSEGKNTICHVYCIILIVTTTFSI